MAVGKEAILGLVLLAILIAGLVVCATRTDGKLLEKFIVTVDEVEIPDKCPDYLATDGAKYYLVWNNKMFDGVNNPLTFDTQAGAYDWLAVNKCPQLETVSLTRMTNLADPTVSYERECNKQTANPNYWLSRCAFDKIYDNKDSLDANNGGGGGLTAADLENLRPELLVGLDKSKIKTDGYLSDLGADTYGYLRRLNDTLTGMDTPDLVNYDVETCMYDKLSKDMPNLGSADGLQRFRRYYNQQIANTLGRKPGENEADVVLTPDSLAEFNKYFEEANDLSITNDMMDKLFGSSSE